LRQMRKTISIILVWFIAVIPASVLAAELKIGVLHTAKVLEEAPQTEIARTAIEKEFQPRRKEIDELLKKLRQKEEKLTRDGAIMSENERRKLERDVRTRQRDIKRLQDEIREDFNIRRNDALDKVQRQVREAVNIVGERGKFDLILNDEVLFYMSNKVDITAAVIKELKASKNNSKKPKK